MPSTGTGCPTTTKKHPVRLLDASLGELPVTRALLLGSGGILALEVLLQGPSILWSVPYQWTVGCLMLVLDPYRKKEAKTVWHTD